ncbi:MAG: Rpn family recombination-promoting nuclease/putative transposase [Streptococcaceae bacterium]|jgi:predicted transposase/invertase (TIGR01784 family)|nr:Rpn family recombination-promoting nuclease/putative transposase [Streptococcaceae bacterium]
MKTISRDILNSNGTYKLLNDVAFKKLLGSDENKQVTKQLLEDIFGIKIQHITLLNPYHIDKMKEKKKLMYTQVDVLIELENGKKVSIELQNQRKEFFQQRSLYYLSKAYMRSYNDPQYQEYFDDKEDFRYSSLKGAIGLNFLNYTQFKDDKLPLHLYSLKEEQTQKAFVEENHFALYFIELNKHHYASGKLKEWMILLKNGENISKRPEFLENVYKPVRKLRMSLEEELEAEEREKDWQDYLATKLYFENGLKRKDKEVQEAKKAQEIAENNLKQGIEQGIEQGINENQIQMLKVLKEKGFKKSEIESIYPELSQIIAKIFSE